MGGHNIRRRTEYLPTAHANGLTNHVFVERLPHFGPALGASNWAGFEPSRGCRAYADHRTRRRRPKHPDLGLDCPRSRGLPDHDLHRWRLRPRRLQDLAAGPRHPRHQDAAHGRHGAAAAAAPEDRHAGDLPHLQGRGDRRAVRPQDGRRRFHPQTVLAAAAGRAREIGAAALDPEGPDRRAEARRHQGARARPACAWTPSGTPAPGRTSR